VAKMSDNKFVLDLYQQQVELSAYLVAMWLEIMTIAFTFCPRACGAID
jgi:hypothetical protein